MPGGRPTDYSPEMADRICELTATYSWGLQKLSDKFPELPTKSTINLWRYKHPEFSSQYAQAKLIQADLLAEDCLDIADDSGRDTTYDDKGNARCDTEWVNRCRLRIDTRKFLAAKLLPKQYGEAAKSETKEDLSVLENILNGKITINK